MTSNSFRKGQVVEWKWGTGSATGKIEERFERHVERTIKGGKIVRNGSSDDPAYLIRQDDGDEVLKLGSEVKAG